MNRKNIMHILMIILALTLIFVVPIGYAQSTDRSPAYIGYKFWSTLGIVVGLLWFLRMLFGKKK